MERLQANPYTVQRTIVEGGEAICVLTSHWFKSLHSISGVPPHSIQWYPEHTWFEILSLQKMTFKQKTSISMQALGNVRYFLCLSAESTNLVTLGPTFGVLHSQIKLVPIDLGLRIATITTWCTDDSNDNIAQEYLQPSEMVSETPKSTFKGDHGTNTTEGTWIELGFAW